MTRIDFYQLESGRFSPDQLLCQLSLKAHQNKQRVLLLTQSEQESHRLDNALWTFDDTNFVPHGVNDSDQPLTRINICHSCQANDRYDILININTIIPEHIGQFSRVIELVHDNNKESAREHYRYYKDRGYPINHSKV